jgi:DNA-binding transcriptional LysR family regulator
MDLRYLETFIAVVDHGTLAEAARRTGLTSAALSARIHALEAALGEPLLQRSGRTLQLTAAGLRIVGRARGMLRDLHDLQIEAAGRALHGELRLGMFPSATVGILPRVLAALYEELPDLRVFVHPEFSPALCQKVASGELDAAIVVEPQFTLPKNCEWHSVVQETLVAVAPRALGHLDAHTLLSSQPYIRYDRASVGGRLADRYLRAHGLTPQQRLELDSMHAIAELVGHGLGVSLLPDWAPLWHASLQIARVALPHPAGQREVGIVWGAQGPKAVLVRSLIAAAEHAWASLACATSS